jgi:NAD(P)-dependent dehydrogenase (short-subunit alcohol dehydrogenase family)
MVPVYAGAKHGVVGFMRSLAPELKKENIRVNCTLPGAVRTNLCDEDTWNGFDSDNFTTVKNIVDNVVRVLEDPTITGEAVEISKDKYYYRDQHDFCDEQQARTMGAAAAM